MIKEAYDDICRFKNLKILISQRNPYIKLQEREIDTISGLNLANAFAHNGNIFCNGHELDELDLFLK